MERITDNTRVVLAVLADRANGVGFAREVLADARLNGKTFNGVNATLAAAVAKGWATKEKALYGAGDEAKILTRYTITDAGRAVIAPEADAE